MGQYQSFCWKCGRVNGVHHPTCVDHPNNLQNPTTTPSGTAPAIMEPQEDQHDPGVPPVRKQRCVRTCLTVWVAILCSLGLIAIILAIAFASQLRTTFGTAQRRSLQQAALASGIVGAVLAVPGILLSIIWCSAFCCCKKRWICGCCGRGE